MQEKIAAVVGRVSERLNAQHGLKSVYYVGCGGSWASSHIAYYFTRGENTSALNVGHMNSNEFLYATPNSVDGSAIVIVTSLKATPESLEALKTAKRRGAYTIAVTGADDTLTAQAADDYIVYAHSEHWACSTHSVAAALRLGGEILRQFNGYESYGRLIAAIDSVDERFAELCEKNIGRGIRFALDFKDDELFHVYSSGTMYGVGYGESFCHLAEMQHRNAIPINSGEYFHGPFENTLPKQASVLFMGVGRYRPVDERIKRFLQQFCDRLFIVDAAEFGLSDIDSDVVEYIAPLLAGPLFRSFVEQMADQRQHPMTTRRYMWKFNY
jgi:fructoselysine 6-phosphate deglycase